MKSVALVSMAVLLTAGGRVAGHVKPNILLIMADDLGAEALACYGNTVFTTPNLDRMAEEGARFDNAYSTPVCSPTRAMILTGLYPNRTGILERLDSPDDKKELINRLPVHLKTFGAVFKSEGYATAIAGKWHLGNFRTCPDQPMSHGFDEYCLWVQHLDGTIHSRYYAPHNWENGAFRQHGEEVYGPDYYSDFLIDFMKQNRDKPFLAYYPMNLIHGPLHVPPGLKELAESKYPDDLGKNERLAGHMTTYMDAIVGKLLAALDELGLAENTLVVFTGDNGCSGKLVSHLGDFRLPGGKRTMNEAGTRVPFIARWPGKIPTGTRDQMFSLADVLPTLASIADIPFAHTVDGIDLSHNLLGTSGEDREYFPMAFEGDCWFVRDNRFRLHEDGRFYDVPVGRNETRYRMQILDRGLHAESRDRLQRQLDRFMKITKTDASYTIIPFGVKGDNFKTRQLEKRRQGQEQ
jgi:arylsulfatase A